MTIFQPVVGSNDLEGLVTTYQKQLNVEALSYLEGRAISEKTVQSFELGYEDFKIGFSVHQARYVGHLAGRITFPIRDIDGKVLDIIGRSLDDREPKYKSLIGIPQMLFNAPVLQEAEEVVLAGGLFDVLNLSQVPMPAVAVPDCFSFHKDQAQLFAGKRVFICYGNDDDGRRESERVANLLDDLADVFIVTLPEGIKDINDLYVRAENATEVMVSLIERAIQTKQESGIAPDSHYLTMYSEEFLKRHRGQLTGIPTGLVELDDLLLGGFQPGLYVLRGSVGVGKSTLIRQMADHMAALGSPVAFFSWGATAFELWANSMSRMIPCAMRDVLLGHVSPDVIKQANERYQEYASHMWTLEGTMDTTVADISEHIQLIAQTIGKEPIVFLDHLQRISFSDEQPMVPSQERSCLVITALHAMAREYNCPIIVTATMEWGTALFETVEAAADVVMHLYEEEEGLSAEPLMVLEVERNRNGDTGKIQLEYRSEVTEFRSAGEFSRNNGADSSSA